MTREVRRRGATNESRDSDRAADQALAADVADADREIDAFVDDIDRAIGQLDVEAAPADDARRTQRVPARDDERRT